MTDEQIIQKALEYSGCSQEWFDDISYVGESTAYDDAHAFYDGAHSRDEEIEELKSLIKIESEIREGLLRDKHKLQDELDQLRNPWRDAKKDPPKEGVRVLVKYAKRTSFGYYYGDNYWNVGDYGYCDFVDYWMPIPQIEKGE